MWEMVKSVAEEGIRSGFVQVILWATTGWAGYWIAYHGFPQPNGWERLPAWFIYGLPYLGLLELVNACGFPKIILILALPVSFLMGVAWSKWGRNTVVAFFAKHKISNETGRASLLDDIHANELGDIIVTLNDGRELCSTLDDHKDCKLKSGRVDKQGNMCLYVDGIWHEVEGEYQYFEPEKLDNDYKELTYIPVEQIKLIQFSVNESGTKPTTRCRRRSE